MLYIKVTAVCVDEVLCRFYQCGTGEGHQLKSPETRSNSNTHGEFFVFFPSVLRSLPTASVHQKHKDGGGLHDHLEETWPSDLLMVY